MCDDVICSDGNTCVPVSIPNMLSNCKCNPQKCKQTFEILSNLSAAGS